MADPAIVLEFAREMGFTPEIVRIPVKEGVEIHALPLSEQLETSPLGHGSLRYRVDALAKRIHPDAIRHVYGRRLKQPVAV